MATPQIITHASPTSGFPPGPRYTLSITFHGASHLPIADIPSFTSDPYIIATLRFPGTQLPKMHYRTQTQRSTLSPRWEETWGIANVPVTGAIIKVKIMDEDPGNHDDKLGVTKIETGSLDDVQQARSQRGSGSDEGSGSGSGSAADIESKQTLKAGRGTWVGLLKVATVMCGKWSGLNGTVEVGIHVGEMPPTPPDLIERAYTVFPNWWSQHFSPLIGIITHTTAEQEAPQPSAPASGAVAVSPRKPRIQHFSFAATKIQLTGPLPASLCHKYVVFRPIIKTFYTKKGLLGIALNRALKHQYRTIYSYNKSTTHGVVNMPEDLAKKVLEFTHWGEGGRVYTYIITLDAEWRFTETGKEFGIQMLSKHTMHSCVSINVGFAGEFFVRRLAMHQHPAPATKFTPAPGTAGKVPPSRRVEDYELVIDNDSGTYRPPPEHLGDLQRFLDGALPGLRVRAADAFDEDHIAMKKAHAAEKERRAGRAMFKQPSSSPLSSDDDDAGNISFSSGDEEELQTGRISFGRKYKRKLWSKVEGAGDPRT